MRNSASLNTGHWWNKKKKITAGLPPSKCQVELMASGLQGFLQGLIQSLVKSIETKVSSELTLRENVFSLKGKSV